jgi:hypothetical protein
VTYSYLAVAMNRRPLGRRRSRSWLPADRSPVDGGAGHGDEEPNPWPVATSRQAPGGGGGGAPRAGPFRSRRSDRRLGAEGRSHAGIAADVYAR